MDLPQTQQEVCSPVHRCFPPRPTQCLFCRSTSVEDCPFRKHLKEQDAE